MNQKNKISAEKKLTPAQLDDEGFALFDSLKAQGKLPARPAPLPLPEPQFDDEPSLDAADEPLAMPNSAIRIFPNFWKIAIAASLVGLVLSTAFDIYSYFKWKKENEQNRQNAAEIAQLRADFEAQKRDSGETEPLKNSPPTQFIARPDTSLVAKFYIPPTSTDVAGAPAETANLPQQAHDFFRKKDFASAERTLQKMLDKNPENSDALQNWLVCQAMQLPKRQATFEKNFGEALQKSPSDFRKNLLLDLKKAAFGPAQKSGK